MNKTGISHTPNLFACAWLMFGSACSPMLIVPPTHVSQGESPRALRAGQISAGGSFTGIGLTSGIFNAGVGARMLSGETTLGLGRDLDARLMGSFARLSSSGEDEDVFGSDENVDYYHVSGFDRHVYGSTLRVKWNPKRGGWAMTLGAGLGHGLDQNFYSLEHAQIVGFENRYLVPYMNIKGMLNGPLNARPVVWDSTPYWHAHSRTPRTSFGLEVLLGVRIPLTNLTSAPDGKRANHPFLRGEVGLMTLSETDTTNVFGPSFSVGVVFPLRN